MKKIKVKTIDVNTFEWFDKTYGNSYFAGTVTINYSLPTQKIINLPFQYGYGSHGLDMAGKAFAEDQNIKVDNNRFVFWRYCEENKIVLRYSKQENCKKRDLMQF